MDSEGIGAVLPRRAAGREQWLTLDQAAKRLGVHPTTLRRWVDQGAMDVFLTPGGHRRFLLKDVERFEAEHHRTRLPATKEQQWADCALLRARQGLPNERWLAAYGEGERAHYRQLGRRLIGLLLQYAARPNNGDDLLAEARAIGRLHASDSLGLGRPLTELLKIISFFRSTMLEVAILQVPAVTAGEPEASIHLLRRIERLVDEVQTGVVELYLGGS